MKQGCSDRKCEPNGTVCWNTRRPPAHVANAPASASASLVTISLPADHHRVLGPGAGGRPARPAAVVGRAAPACLDPGCDLPRSIPASAFRMSPGSEMNTGPVGGCHRDLGGTAHDAGQVLQPGDLDRPFHQRFGHGHQRVIEQRLGQPVPLFLLARGQDHRRVPGELGIVERSQSVAEARCYMHVAGHQVAGRAREPVRHRLRRRDSCIPMT